MYNAFSTIYGVRTFSSHSRPFLSLLCYFKFVGFFSLLVSLYRIRLSFLNCLIRMLLFHIVYIIFVSAVMAFGMYRAIVFILHFNTNQNYTIAFLINDPRQMKVREQQFNVHSCEKFLFYYCVFKRKTLEHFKLDQIFGDRIHSHILTDCTSNTQVKIMIIKNRILMI